MRLTRMHGNPLPSKINMSYGQDALTVLATDDNGNPAVGTTWYLTTSDLTSASFGGSLNQPGPPYTYGADPSVPAKALADWSALYPQAYATISGTSVTYFLPAQSNNNLAVKAKIVAQYLGQTRELLIEID